MRKPLIPENWHDTNDLPNRYNPDKYENNLGNYAQNNNDKTIEQKTAVKSGDVVKKEAKAVASTERNND